MSGNLLVRFDEGRVGRTLCRPLSYSTPSQSWNPADRIANCGVLERICERGGKTPKS